MSRRLDINTTRNTASNNPSIVIMSRCTAIDWISLPRERARRLLLRNGCLSAYFTAIAVLVLCFEVSAQQWVYTLQYTVKKGKDIPVTGHGGP
jgi:hypothetical protein